MAELNASLSIDVSQSIRINSQRESFHKAVARSILIRKQTVSAAKTNPYKRFVGIFLIVLSSIATSIVSVCAKYLANQQAPAFQVALFRMIGQLVISFALTLSVYFNQQKNTLSSTSINRNKKGTGGDLKLINEIYDDDDNNELIQEETTYNSFCSMLGFTNGIKDLALLILNGVCYVTSATFYQVSLGILNLADASVIYFTMPIWTAILGFIFLREKLNTLQTIGVILSFVGAVIDARPSVIFGKEYGEVDSSTGTGSILFGIIACLSGSIAGSAYIITARSIATKYHSYVIAMYPGIVGCIILPILTAAVERFENPFKSLWVIITYIGCGLFTALSQTLLNAGLQYESAAIAGVIRTSDILFNAAWSAVLFHDIDTWLSYIGIGVVFIACVVIGVDKYRKSKTN